MVGVGEGCGGGRSCTYRASLSGLIHSLIYIYVYKSHVHLFIYFQRFCGEAESHRGDYESLEAESEEWAEHLIPETFQENLLSPSEPSPPPFSGNYDTIVTKYSGTSE